MLISPCEREEGLGPAGRRGSVLSANPPSSGGGPLFNGNIYFNFDFANDYQ